MTNVTKEHVIKWCKEIESAWAQGIPAHFKPEHLGLAEEMPDDQGDVIYHDLIQFNMGEWGHYERTLKVIDDDDNTRWECNVAACIWGGAVMLANEIPSDEPPAEWERKSDWHLACSKLFLMTDQTEPSVVRSVLCLKDDGQIMYDGKGDWLFAIGITEAYMFDKGDKVSNAHISYDALDELEDCGVEVDRETCTLHEYMHFATSRRNAIQKIV